MASPLFMGLCRIRKEESHVVPAPSVTGLLGTKVRYDHQNKGRDLLLPQYHYIKGSDAEMLFFFFCGEQLIGGS
jgi:hypothetical protein